MGIGIVEFFCLIKLGSTDKENYTTLMISESRKRKQAEQQQRKKMMVRWMGHWGRMGHILEV